MLEFMKIEIKTNASNSTHLRLEEKKALSKGRLFKVIGARENNENADLANRDSQVSDNFYNLYQNLRAKRVDELRKKQRIMFLAYGFLRGWDYEDLEESCHEHPDFDVVEKYVFFWTPTTDYDPRDLKEQFELWVKDAMTYLKKTDEVKAYIQAKKEKEQ